MHLDALAAVLRQCKDYSIHDFCSPTKLGNATELPKISKSFSYNNKRKDPTGELLLKWSMTFMPPLVVSLEDVFAPELLKA